MKVMKVKNWKELALNRNLGDYLVEKVKPTKGCKASGRRNKKKERKKERKKSYLALRCISNCCALKLLERLL
jgi:hypothetical protein